MREAGDLGENEYALIQAIARKPAVTQRELSTDTGMSLGMTNLLIKRLARKGYIKVSQLDWKRTRYLLTPKGAIEKTVKSLRYGLYTVRIFRQIRENIRTVLQRELLSGRRRFTIVAQDELLELVRESVEAAGAADAKISYARSFKELGADDSFVLAATLEKAPENGREIVSLVDFDNIDFRIR
jgi:DNA-binding MarR family transcriptional regulator